VFIHQVFFILAIILIFMMKYNFDEIIDRVGTASYKYDLREKIFKSHDVLPLWVADMDFRTPEFIVNAIQERTRHELFGYSYHPDSQYESIINWILKRHGWNIKKEWIGFTPGVVPALNLAVLAYTRPGDQIIIQTPVYFPFYSAVEDHDRVLIRNPLVLNNGRYEMDFDHLESIITRRAKMLILCSPHNPTGNVWKQNELEQLADICLRKNILILSDEIHADIIYDGHKHIPVAGLSGKVAQNTVTLMSPSKTFNFAGLSTAYFIISDDQLKKQLQQQTDKFHISMGNIFGNVALEAAYNHGESWLVDLIAYLEQNITFTRKFINTHLSNLKLIEPESTFLLWIDFRKTGYSDEEIRKLLIERAHLGLSNGILFGKEGEGFQRVNIGCPRSILEKAYSQLAEALTEAP
jgi:cystathionine beta-lyase